MKWKTRLVVMTALVAGCDIIGPRPVCGCSPTESWASINGRVVTASDAVAPGATVTLQPLNAQCESATPPSLQVKTTTSTEDGRFRFIEARGMGTICFRLFARPAGAAAGATSDTQIVSIVYGAGGAVPDSVELLLRLK